MLQEAIKQVFREGGQNGSKREVTVIREGWGTSGYYPGEVIERDIPKVFPVGTPMFLDHPTFREELERPERSTKDLVGKLVESPRYAGAEMVSVAQIYPHWEESINAMAEDIGLSINAEGETKQGSAAGRDGPIVESIDIGYSIDFVTAGGAGGKIGPLIEAARERKDKPFSVSFAGIKSALTEGNLSEGELKEIGSTAAVLLENKKPTKEDVMSDAEKQRLTDLEESVGKLEKELKESGELASKEKDRADRAEEALQLREAGKVVSEVVDKVKDLPSKAKTRIIETALRGDLPLNSENKLIESELKEKAEKALKEELEYIGETSGKGKVRGAGSDRQFHESTGRRSEDENNEATTALQEAFERQGMSKDAAKVAAEGR